MSAEAAVLSQRVAAVERSPSRVLGALRSAWAVTTLVLLLAVLAAVPFVNVLVFGYLLEAQGRLARGERLRAAFAGFDELPRLGGALVLSWLWVFPVRLLANAVTDAELIVPGHAGALSMVRWAVAALVGLHLVLGWAKGARPGDLLRPWRTIRWGLEKLRGFAAPSEPWRFDASLARIAWLGVVGLLTSLAWLAIPVGLLILSRAPPGHPPLGVLGGALLLPVLAWLPLMQVRLAQTGRWRAAFDWRGARAVAAAAPVATAAALAALYVFTLPLYLLKAVLPPSDAMWVVTLVFIVTVLPMRIVIARSCARGVRRGAAAGWFARWAPRLVLVPLLIAYVVVLYLTPLIDSHGTAGLLAQHALLLPAPF